MKKYAQNSEEYVRLEAFLLSEKAGHPQGMDATFWAQAETIVRVRLAGLIVPKSSTAKKTPAAKKSSAKSPAAAPEAPAKAKQADKKVAAPKKAPAAKKSVPAKAPAAKKTATAAPKPAPKRRLTDGAGPKST